MVEEQKKFMLSKGKLEEIAKICMEFRVSCLVLFGSMAKEETCVKGDIDIAVLMEDSSFEADQEIKLFNTLVNLFQTGRVDLVVLNRASPLLLKEVAISGKPLYEQKEGIFDRFQIKAIKKYLDSKKFSRLRSECLKEFIVERGI